jgi:hypothetical protein
MSHNIRKKQWYVNKKKTHRMWWCLPFYLSQNRVPRLTVSRQILKCERQGKEKVREEIGGGILNTLTKCWVVYFKEKRKKSGDALRIRKSVNILPLSAASKRLRNRRYIKTLNQKMITTC